LDKSLKPEKKRLFIYLLGISSAVTLLLLFFVWYVSLKGISSVSGIAGIIFSLIVAGFGLFLAFSTFIIVITMISGKQTKIARRMRGLVTRFLFPVVMRVAKILKVDRDKIIRSFIAVNNELVLESLIGKKVNNPLVLLPHCVQLEDCELKITKDILVCKKCGKCDIKGLANIAEKYKLNMSVATCGTIARRIVKETKPDLIIAVACERDLLSGIQDTYPLPVIGVLNERPFGDCLNTKVNINTIEELIKRIYIGGKDGKHS
jgi:hypothetical protein